MRTKRKAIAIIDQDHVPIRPWLLPQRMEFSEASGLAMCLPFHAFGDQAARGTTRCLSIRSAAPRALLAGASASIAAIAFGGIVRQRRKTGDSPPARSG